jgi:ABC-type dipeptide/oligopeptide/nickel transport system ATPase component
VAEYFCDRVAVLYLGAVMELADRETLFHAPLHP